MSAPAAKTSSEPAITTQRTCGSGSSRSSAEEISSIISGESALRASGRFSLRSATWKSSTAVSTLPAISLKRRHRVDTGRGPADDHLLDLGCALVERRDPGVAQIALDRVVVDVAGTAVDLDRQVGAFDGRLGRIQLCHRGLGGVRLAFVLEHA